MWRLYMTFVSCYQHLKIFSEIWVMPVKLQDAVSRASLIFQKRFLDAGSSKGRWNIVSTSCTRSHVATSKQKKMIPKIRKNCPLKPSYVAPRDNPLTRQWFSTVIKQIMVLFKYIYLYPCGKYGIPIPPKYG